MLYLVTNLLGMMGLAGIFYLTGWLGDQVLMQGRGLEPISVTGRFGLGATVWMGWVFLLAAVQMLAASTLGLAAMLILVIVWRRRRDGGNAFLAPMGARSAPGDLAAWLLGLLTGAVLLALWIQVLWPRIAWDANVYHLTVPRLYLESGGFRRIPFNVYSNWPLNTQLLFALAMAARDYVLAKAVHFAFGLATLLLIYRVARSAGRSWPGWVGGVLFLVNPVVLDEFRAAYVDLALAFFLLLAFVMVHHALEENEARGQRLLLAGVFSGVAAGIKPTGITAVLCLLALYLVATVRQRRSPRQILDGMARIAVPAGLMLVPWGLKSWILTGNPVYPFFYSVLGGPEWSVELGQQLQQWQQGMGMGRSWADYLLLPIRVVIAGGSGYEHFDGRISPLWLVLVPLAVWVGRRQPLITRSLGVAGLYFVLWALTSQQMRFLIPMLPLLSIAAALSLVELGRKAKDSAGRALQWAVTVLLSATLVLVSSSMLMPAWKSLERYLEIGEAVMDDAVPPVFEYINQELPKGARLMFLNTNHGFFSGREFVADSFFEASQINAFLSSKEGKRDIGEALQELDITHLLVENRDRHVPWPRSLYEFLNDPELSRRIYRSPDSVYDVVEVLGARSPASR